MDPKMEDAMISVMLRMLSGDFIQLTVPEKTPMKKIEDEVYGLYPEIPMGSVRILHPSEEEPIPLLTDEGRLNMDALAQLDEKGDLLRSPLYDGILLHVLIDDSVILPKMSFSRHFPMETTAGDYYRTIRYTLSSYYDPHCHHPLRGRSLLSTDVHEREDGQWTTYEQLYDRSVPWDKRWYPTLHASLMVSSLRFPRSNAWIELLEKECQTNRPS